MLVMAPKEHAKTQPSRTKSSRAWGDGSVFQLPSGRWRAQLYLGMVDGKRKYVTSTKEYKATAEDALKDMRRQVERGIVPDGKMTFDKWFEYWVDQVKTKLAPKTRYEYRRNIALYVSPVIGKKRLRDLQPEHLEAVYAQMRKKGLSKSTIKQVHAPISAALETAVRRQRISYNPARLVEDPYGEAREPVSHPQWNTAQAKKVLAFVRDKPSDQVRMMCALLLALRQGEALALRWCDVHEDELLRDPDDKTTHTGYLHVEHSITRVEVEGKKTRARVLGPTKNKQANDIPLPEPVRDAFRRLRAVRTHDVWVFPGARNSDVAPRENSIDTDLFKSIAKKAGVGTIPLHGARGTTASVLSDLGVPGVTISKILRHLDLTVALKNYTRADLATQAKGLEKLTDQWGDALRPSDPNALTQGRSPRLDKMIMALTTDGQTLTEAQIAQLAEMLGSTE